jgi:CHAD domain-containing protein
VKQLRYTLDLSSYPDQKLATVLGSVKDTIGEWHDWCELETIARNSIPAHNAFCNRIHSISEERLDRAFAIANDMLIRYFDNAAGKHSGQQHSKTVQLKHPILISAAQMGA